MVLKGPKAAKQRGRPPNATRKAKAPPSSSNAPATSSQPKKRGRPSLGEQIARKRAEAAQSQSKPASSAGPSKSRPTHPSSEQSASANRKRKVDTAGLPDREDELALNNDYVGLKARTRHIPKDVIQTKWSAALAPVQQQVRELFKAAKRAVISNRRNDQQRREAEQVLAYVVMKLEQQLPRMPFPPNTKEFHFDLEKLIGRNRSLENQLTPAIHSVELLKAEIEKEELALERDRANLDKLEANARAEERKQKQQTAKVHPLLKRTAAASGLVDDADSIGLVPSKREESSLFVNLDTDLAPLLNQLRSHLESMQSNHEQVEGIDSAMERAHAALDSVLYANSAPETYESSVLA